jgi:hypothetical protein
MRVELNLELNAGRIGRECLRVSVRRPAIRVAVRLALREQMQLQHILEAQPLALVHAFHHAPDLRDQRRV